MINKGKKSAPSRRLSPAPAAYSVDARRLLRALGADGAYAFADADAPARIAIVAQRNGVSIRAGSNTSAAATELCAMDLSQWREPDARNGRARLTLTDAGRAHLARASAQEGLDPFLAQHMPVARGPADETPEAVEVLRDQTESPLVWLASRKGRDGRPMIDVTSLEAGERLRRDLTLAQIMPSVTASWSAPVSGGGGAMHFSDFQVAARQRVDLALSAVGPEFAGILVDICGFLKGLELIETERGWPQRSAKVVLVMALKQLQRHYGIDSKAEGPSRSRGVVHWGTQDFRPALSSGSN
jgi:hypothetical protein